MSFMLVLYIHDYWLLTTSTFIQKCERLAHLHREFFHLFRFHEWKHFLTSHTTFETKRVFSQDRGTIVRNIKIKKQKKILVKAEAKQQQTNKQKRKQNDRGSEMASFIWKTVGFYVLWWLQASSVGKDKDLNEIRWLRWWRRQQQQQQL